MNPALLGGGNVPWSRTGAVRWVADGNSITAGTQDGPESNGGVTGYLSRHLAPFVGHSYRNVAIGGQTIDNMIAAASDVDGAFDPTKINVLFVQEGTNQANTSTTPAANCQKVLDYCAARRAARPWGCIVVATAPPVYLGDNKTQAENDDYNARLDEFNRLLRKRWHEAAGAFVETRCAGGPFDQARYPNYLRSTFFDTTVVNGISNTASFITEPTSGPVPNCKIHPTAAGFAALAPFVGRQLIALPVRTA